MSKYKTVYPGVYTPEEQAVLDAYQAEKDALNSRGDINIDDLIHGRIPKGTPGVGRVDMIDQRKLQSNYLMPDPTNPLYFDKEYVKNSPYGDVIAFPLMVAHDGAFFDAMPYQLRDTLTISGLTHDFDILKPVYEGDTLYYITDEQTFTDITPKEGSEFRTFDITGKGRVYNQKGELVCRGRSRVKESLRLLKKGSNPKPMIAQDCPDWWSMAPVHYVTDAEWDMIRGYWRRETVRGAEPLYWEDVNVGDMPVPTVNGPFQQLRIGGPPPLPEGDMPDLDELPMHPGPMEEEDPEPVKTIRQMMEDPELAKTLVRSKYDGAYYPAGELPNPDKKRSIIMNFHARDTAFRMITNWCGDHGWVSNIKWRIMRKTPGYDTPDFPDNPPSFLADVPAAVDPQIENWYDDQQHGLEYDFLITKGYVTKKYVKDGKHCVDLAWWISRLFGKVYEEGIATVELPSREKP